MKRIISGLAVSVAVTLGATGCQWDGLNSLPMPGSEGRGPGSYTVRIQMPNVTTLTRNSPVRVDDVEVGNVTGIEVEGWHALVTVSLNPEVRLPANAIAKIGQTSLLGSNHVELSAPTNTPAEGQLRDNDLIPLERAGAYPTTEQVLSSLSVVLNGGGIAQLETITRELNAALNGREAEIADLLPQLNQLTTGLDKQTGDIIAAMEGLDRLTGKLADQKSVLARAIDEIHPALTALADRTANITRAITSLGDLSEVTERIIQASGDDLKANLASLGPVLETLANTGTNLIDSMRILPTFPFPIKNIGNAIKGDYLNLYITVDLTAKRLDSNWLTGTPLGGRFGGVEGVIGSFAPPTATDASDPTKLPQAPAPAAAPAPTLPGLPSIPGLPAIPGITVPLPGQEGAGR
ncbi:MCE family protein [Nocardia alba]|uniref:Phospholipid/cholesterol/gamma-HCH transport system substrate-binding protein n=1 Tax=Nocardia alba TaxID=225051 RepID=A0A4R1FZQ8_9NOCA|nr:MCE family protein [Nocardia alba]TCK01287.1 phospholipid/cholesterol/gamma-HCH transport system substrate-binding protein [Nocardia alba]